MPSKVAYKTYPILVKSHKFTIFLEAPPTRTIASIKEETLTALTSRVGKDTEEIPEVKSIDDFELCCEIKERGRQPTGKYEVLQGNDVLKNVAQAWEVMFIRFRDASGKLRPVEVTLPSILQPDEDEVYPEPSSSKGKRKAPAG